MPMSDDDFRCELRRAFDQFDANRDGKISADELKVVMNSLGQNPTPEELLKMIQEVDIDKNGFIDFEEFMEVVRKRIAVGQNGLSDGDLVPPFYEEELLRDAFTAFDANKDGVISAGELKSLMKSLGEQLTDEQLERMIEEADLDGDRHINFQEFVRVMTQD